LDKFSHNFFQHLADEKEYTFFKQECATAHTGNNGHLMQHFWGMDNQSSYKNIDLVFFSHPFKMAVLFVTDL
jgi:hypothetical protein